MKINDLVYGEFFIEPLLENLINTPELQRLKNIHQGGASYLVNSKWNVTRYEHSIGTMLLIKLLGGSLEEQIAGLLHDISHTAFSHVVDFALNNKAEDYHENIFINVIENSAIPKILENHGYNHKEILYNESKWTILEKSAPALCADRIDYTLRDMLNYGTISNEEVKEFLPYLKVVNGEIVITSIEKAEWFTQVYYKEVIDFFMHPLNAYAYNKLSEAIKIALELNEITLTDLSKDDSYVLSQLKNSNFKDIKSLMNDLNYNVKVVEDSNNYQIHQKNKVRIIDPNIFIDNCLYKSSEKSKLIKILNKKALEKSKKGVYVNVLKTK
ncbi:hypothetical protein SAMN02745163_03486 [Clostridium cavendishii DSM 21758]|uniref:HD/PDEase domain-containing protein n=1 Tax=Clostridium cavendishii DSM 21758 TaxID=1121302 RepID=A0A1M6QXG1_9CLOT|nr:HD domain-containing protein [Clostridium cavendishii]SHK24885.1 hypothetical protein SAMN02745163_03486 [Clostridium cavendishii DSM 21758]